MPRIDFSQPFSIASRIGILGGRPEPSSPSLSSVFANLALSPVELWDAGDALSWSGAGDWASRGIAATAMKRGSLYAPLSETWGIAQFHGTPGHLTSQEYWMAGSNLSVIPGARALVFVPGGVDWTGFIRDHDGAGWTGIFLHNPGTLTTYDIGHFCVQSASNGFGVFLDNDGEFQWRAVRSSAPVTTAAGNIGATAPAGLRCGIVSVDPTSAEDSFLFCNGRVFTFDGSYGGSDLVVGTDAVIGDQVGLCGFSDSWPADYKLYGMVFLPSFISQAQAAAVYAAIKGTARFSALP